MAEESSSGDGGDGSLDDDEDVFHECFDRHHCLALAILGIFVASVITALLLLNCYCWRVRGIGLRGIIQL